VYETSPGGSSLGFTLPRFLTPPRSIRNLASDLTRRIVGAVARGTQITVPTPAGDQTFDLGNPNDLQMLRNMAAGTRITTKPESQGGAASVAEQVSEHVPGGWGTIAVVGGLLVAFLMFGRKR
jgi:hypothetical protein